jgi:hypothetical protein
MNPVQKLIRNFSPTFLGQVKKLFKECVNSEVGKVDLGVSSSLLQKLVEVEQ